MSGFYPTGNSVYHLEKYITILHFRRLGLLLFVLTLIYLYFNVNEYWTPAYKMAEAEGHLLNDLFYGRYAWAYWTTQIAGIAIPLLVLGLPKFRSSIKWIVAVALLNAVAAWVKRYLIIVPTMMHPYTPIQDVPQDWTTYMPTFLEFSITFGTFAGFLLLYTGFSRVFPIISIDEVAEGVEEVGLEKVGLDPADYEEVTR